MAKRSDAEPVGLGERLGDAAVAWASVRWVAVGGRPVRYREAGDGPVTLVLVHGLGVSADYWMRNGPPIAAAGFRVLAPDLPGFGRTTGPRDGLDVGASAEALRCWAEALDLRPAAYLGHSLSCQTVLQLAVHHPALVRALVLAAPTGQAAGIRRLLHQAVGLVRDVHRESMKLAALVAQSYLRAGPRRVLRTWRMGAYDEPLPLLPHVHVPVLVLLGDRDPVVPLEFARRIVADLPEASLRIIPGAAHAVIFDPTGQFNQAVVEFLKRKFEV